MKTKKLLFILAAISFTNLFATNYDVSVYTDGAATDVNTLRWAITQINLNSTGWDVITFSGTPSPITLTSTLPDLSKNMAINNVGSQMITIKAFPGSRIFKVNGSWVEMYYLTLQDASTNANGGAVWNNGSLTAKNCIFQNNTVTATTGNVSGGALYATSNLTNLENCTFTNNKAISGGGFTGTGGAINNAWGSLTIKNTTFDSNQGTKIGGIASSSTLTCTGCTFTNNTSISTTKEGSAVSIPVAITSSFTNCSFTGNTGGPALFCDRQFSPGQSTAGQLDITNCVIKNNTSTTNGGGVNSAAVTTITNSEISGNTANGDGGGVALYGGSVNSNYTAPYPTAAIFKSKLTMTNCTVSGNSAASSKYGGGVMIKAYYSTGEFFTDDAQFTNCTISGNSCSTGTTASGGGGGVDIGGGQYALSWTIKATFDNCTIYGNTNGRADGAGIITSGSDAAVVDKIRVILNYSIVIGNTAAGAVNKDIKIQGDAFLGSTTGRNLYGGISGGSSFGYAGSVTTGNVLLGSTPISSILNTTLADNGGMTVLQGGTKVKTHALVSGSPAIDPDMALSGLQTVDQRGYARDTKPDMGAYEFGGVATAINTTLSDNLKIYQSGSEIVLDLNGISGKQNVTIYDLRANNVHNSVVSGGTIATIHTGLSKGIYLVRVQGVDKQTTTKFVFR